MGAARLAYNHGIGRAVANLNQRAAERSYGVAKADLTPALSWSKVSFINHMNAWKDGRATDARVSLDEGGSEVRGLGWRGEVSADVFECASVNAAAALASWSKSRQGARAGKAAGFPRFKSRHKSPPAFRLRSKSKPGATSPVRPAGPRVLRLPKLGELRTREHTGQLARMLTGGRFHVYAASFRLERGRWVVAITGVGAQLHHLARSPKGRAPGLGWCGPRGQDPRGRLRRARTCAAHVGGGESTAERPGTPEAGQPVLLENQEGLRW